MMNGINDKEIQQDITKTIIFELNEMPIGFGKEYSNVFHADVRGFTKSYKNYRHKKTGYCWCDELHP